MADLRRAGCGLLATAALLAGCSGGDPVTGATGAAASAAPGASSSAASPTRPARPATSPTAQRTPRTTVPPDVASARPEEDPASPPPPTSGPLGGGSLAAPATLGRGWRYRIDPGGAEEGYATSGEPATARAPAEAVTGLAPYGCPDLAAPPHLPLPRYAVEVTYVHRPDGAPGVGMALEFASREAAATFLRRYVRAQAACSSGRAQVPDGTAVAVLQSGSGVAVVRRRDPVDAGGTVWVEAIATSGRRVLLTALADTAAADVDPQRLARALRRALR